MRWRRRLLVFPVTIVAVQAALVTPTLSARLDITPISTSQADQRIGRAVVEVLALGCDLSLRQGTAVAIGTNRAITNEHVAGTFRSLDLATDAAPAVPAAPSAVAVASGADLAVVTVANLEAQPLALATEDPAPGEVVRVAGFPHDPGPSALTTPSGLVTMSARVVDYVSGRGMGQEGLVMRLDVGARPGMSGGPVLDESGRLAGLVFGVQEPTDEALVIPASVIRLVLAAPLELTRGC